MKTCRQCNETKIETDFNKATTKGGIMHVCRSCQNERQKEIGNARRAAAIKDCAVKVCGICKQCKDIEAFPPTNTSRDGFRNTCHACMCKKQSDRYFANPEPVLAACKEWRAKPENKKRRSATDKKHRQTHVALNILHRSKTSARANGIAHNLTLDDIIIPAVCPVLGMPLEVNKGDTSKKPENIPSIDRVIPELGYVKGNVRIISFRANRLKNNATLDESRAITRYIEEHTGRASHPEDDPDRYP